MLQDLPAELLLEIISLLSFRDTLMLGTTCKAVYSTVAGVPKNFHRHWVLQYLKLIPKNIKIGTIQQEADKDVDWMQAMREVVSLFKRLAKCPPPGCGLQKYLRWLQHRPADCDIVRRVLVGVSMLPTSFREMTEIVNKDESKICFTERSKIILNWLFPKEKNYRIKIERLLEVDKLVDPFFNFNKFQVLMEYVMDSNERLRLVMAEYHQISCRGLFEDVGFLSWTRPSSILVEIESGSSDENFTKHGRQIGALLDLIKLNNQSPGIRFWA
eukprot:GFUD01022142.1.p1 GENE.GFUD01022142.1~~GFUD01022142.1.p1  ORF type:complete len:271 (+),score=57.20 GFUD01022142.1:82-894(+)